VLIFIRQFGALVADTGAALRTVQQACGQVRESRLLRRVLAVVLAAGNHLNAGTARGECIHTPDGTLYTILTDSLLLPDGKQAMVRVAAVIYFPAVEAQG
jgi:hypothetical protein